MSNDVVAEKKRSKRKKKEKHQRKKEAKRQAKIEKVVDEEEKKPDQLEDKILEEPSEISGRDIMGLKTSVDPDEIPEIPAHKFLMRHTFDDDKNNETSNIR